uniref:protein rogdi homolog isoform X3 n=1 Tax=Myxine glutinosa TaxID=7769 RepID=UPI003590157B
MPCPADATPTKRFPHQEKELRWILEEEVHNILGSLYSTLKEVCRFFPMSDVKEECHVKQENFKLSATTSDAVKGVLTLQGDTLCQVDLHMKLSKQSQPLHTFFRGDKRWKMQQIQDAGNHLHLALQLVSSHDKKYEFCSGAEVNKLMESVLQQLNRARNRLTIPAAMTLPDLVNTNGAKMFNPPLPSDVLVNFYVHHNKLCLILYQVHPLQTNLNKNFKAAGGSVCHSPGAMFEYGGQKLEISHTHKVESTVSWLNQVLLYTTLALQLSQQLRDKVSVFENYWTKHY